MKTIEGKAGMEIDFSKVQDLINEDEIMQEIDAEDLIVDDEEEEDLRKSNKKQKKRSKSEPSKEEDPLHSAEFE